jgi:Transglycosylase-like domain
MTLMLTVLLTVTGPAHAPAAPGFDPARAAGEAMTAIGVFVTAADQVAVDQALSELLERTVEYVRSVTPPPPPPPSPAARSVVPPSAGGVAGGGGCYAGPIPAYIVNRESGGNPNAVNASSGAYGCFQIMPYVWNANCGDLDRGVNGQIACADRISNGGTNLAPWR